MRGREGIRGREYYEEGEYSAELCLGGRKSKNETVVQGQSRQIIWQQYDSTTSGQSTEGGRCVG